MEVLILCRITKIQKCNSYIFYTEVSIALITISTYYILMNIYNINLDVNDIDSVE